MPPRTTQRRSALGKEAVAAPTSVSQLQADPKNARRHGDRNIGAIVSGLEEVGAARSIVIDEDSVILAGNATVDAARKAGITKVRVVDVDGQTLVAVRRTGLTDAQKARLAIIDNRAAELAEGWNADVLRSMQDIGVNLDDLWSPGELAELLADTDGDGRGLTDPDQVPAPRQTNIQLGDILALGDHRLICADTQVTTEIGRLLDGERIDLAVTSPPYNVNMKYRTHVDRVERDKYLAFIRASVSAFVPYMGKGRFVAWNIGVSPKTFPAHQVVTLEECGLSFYRQIVWQKSGVAYPIFPSTMRTKRARHYKPNYTHEVMQVFEAPGDEEAVLEEMACDLCEGTGYRARRELPCAEAHETVQLMVVDTEELGAAMVPNRKYQNDVWHISQAQSTVGLKTIGAKSTTLQHGGKSAHMLKEHPAPFPVELPKAFIGFLTSVGEVVFDGFGGTGSTLLACEQMKRLARLVEIDPVYCQIVVDRWEAFTGRKATKL